MQELRNVVTHQPSNIVSARETYHTLRLVKKFPSEIEVNDHQSKEIFQEDDFKLDLIFQYLSKEDSWKGSQTINFNVFNPDLIKT